MIVMPWWAYLLVLVAFFAAGMAASAFIRLHQRARAEAAARTAARRWYAEQRKGDDHG